MNSTQNTIVNLLKAKLAAKHGAFNVRVFGSVARNEADIESDIDFLVDYYVEEISPWFPAGLMLDLEALLGRKVDIATESALKERIQKRHSLSL